jgi:hypothetical protein
MDLKQNTAAIRNSIITTDIIHTCISSLLFLRSGSEDKGNTLLLMNEFKELHGSSFSLENGLRLHSVLQYYGCGL